jgi:hypothetical protein
MSLVISKVFTYDTDAGNYIQAVEAADGQALEAGTRQAINDFVVGCKQDGIWPAIKASCILSGARTLNGALQPLVGTAPTNNGFVGLGTDYVRKTGLVGNGSSKSLNSNRAANADPQNSRHLSVYMSTAGAINEIHAGDATFATNGNSVIYRNASDQFGGRSVHQGGLVASDLIITTNTVSATVPCLFGIVRTGANAQSLRGGKQTVSNTISSVSPATANTFIFTNSANEARTTARLAFYSIGESLDLALLDARVTALITAFGVAIP